MPRSDWRISHTRMLTAEYVIKSVGDAGTAVENLDERGPNREAMRLSRGGIVLSETPLHAEEEGSAPTLKRVEAGYHAGLAVVSYAVQTPALEIDIQHYVFDRGPTGVWQGHIVPPADTEIEEAFEVPTYCMDDAEPIDTLDKARFVLGLCQRFDAARELRVQQAVQAHVPVLEGL